MATTTGSCGTNVTYTLNTDTGLLSISGTGAMYDYVNSSNLPPWYTNRTTIKEVVIDSGVTSIGDYAFFYATNLTTTSIPDTVTTIGNFAFYECSKLSSPIKLRNAITIGNSAFEACSRIPELFFGKKLTSIGYTAFYHCYSIGSITFWGNQPQFGKDTFGESSSFSLGNSSKPVTATIYSKGWASDDVFTKSDTEVRGSYTTFKYEPLKAISVPTKLDGEWKNVSSRGKVKGEWKKLIDGYANVKGVWKRIRPRQVYTMIYDKSLASDPSACLTYAGDCKGFTPMVGASGDANEGSWSPGCGTLFDAIEVGHIEGTKWVKESKKLLPENSTYNCFTRIPKIYEKVTNLGNNKVQVDISLEPFEGSRLHPAFVIDGVEINHKYIGTYLASETSSKLGSHTGKKPKVSTTRAEFRTYAKANGSSYGILSYYDWDLVNLLYLFAFKTFDSQSAVGMGYVYASGMKSTGSNGELSWMNGTISETKSVTVLGLEDWWGHEYQMLDNILIEESGVYVSQSSSPPDSISQMTKVCDIPSSFTSGMYALTVQAGADSFFIPEKGGASVGNASTKGTGTCDYQRADRFDRIPRVGGMYSTRYDAGAFHIRSETALTDSDVTMGTRLVHWD